MTGHLLSDEDLSSSFQNASTPFINLVLPFDTTFAPPDTAFDRVFRIGAKF